MQAPKRTVCPIITLCKIASTIDATKKIFPNAKPNANIFWYRSRVFSQRTHPKNHNSPPPFQRSEKNKLWCLVSAFSRYYSVSLHSTHYSLQRSPARVVPSLHSTIPKALFHYAIRMLSPPQKKLCRNVKFAKFATLQKHTVLLHSIPKQSFHSVQLLHLPRTSQRTEAV